MNILAINPWIYDFAAYDFWLKPYGFLVMLSYLKQRGVGVDYIDCLGHKTIPGTFGRGKYYAEIIEKPEVFRSIPRYFKRYGITIEDFRAALEKTKPDYILITSSMTYWYPGIIEVVRLIKEKFPATPIMIGGTYVTLCHEHASHTFPYASLFKNNRLGDFFRAIDIPFDAEEFFATVVTYEHFYDRFDYVVFRTSWGCPFNCNYCAIKELFPDFFRITPEKILNFISCYAQKGMKDFVFYDEALLYEPHYTKTLLKLIAQLDIPLRFHTPNALHMRFLDEEIASLLKKTGFTNPHFGLETLNPELQKLWGDKVNTHDVVKGIEALKRAGFKNGTFSVYLLLGYPGQNLEELRQDVKLLHTLGARVSLAEFSPVPGTEIFKQYGKEFLEPLLQNNSIFGFFQKDKIRDFWEIKNYVRELNKKVSIEGSP